MSESKPTDPRSLMLRIDDVCERFEDDWKSGRAPKLREVINGLDASDEEVPEFFHELFLLELELRAEAGETLGSETYVAEFPDFRDFIESSIRAFNAKKPFSIAKQDPSVAFQTCLRYQLIEPVAEGGLGRIYRVLDQTIGRELAMKEIKQSVDNANTRARFDREARLTGKLDHPGITPVFGIGSHPDGRPLYVMRLIRGESLREVIRQYHGDGTGPGGMTLGMRTLLSKFVSVCDVIAYAHNQGVVHRDLKPSNVMLGPFGEVLVVDWGLAKEVSAKNIGNDESTLNPDGSTADWTAVPADSFQTVPGRAVGTPQFMSPEQAMAKTDEIGPLSDIYSLGATLYDLLTGRPPFSESNESETVLRRVVAGDFISPRKVRPGLPRSLEAVCLKAMKVDPRQRYQDAQSLVEDLRRWLADEPVSARPEPFLEKARRWISKRRVAVSGVTGALLLAFCVGIPLLIRAQFARQDRINRAQAMVSLIFSSKDDRLAGLINGLNRDDAALQDELTESFQDLSVDTDDKLKAALALGTRRPEIRDYLERSLLDAPLSLLPLLCDELRTAHSDRLLETLRATVVDPKQIQKARFEASVALARLEPPQSPEQRAFWRDNAPFVVANLIQMISVDPSLFRGLVKSFEPVQHELFPALAAEYRDTPAKGRDLTAARRTIAGGILDEYRLTAEEIVEMIKDTPVSPRFLRSLAQLKKLGEPAIQTLKDELARPATLPKNADREAEVDKEAIRKSRLAIALFGEGYPEAVWPIFGSTNQPALREELARRLPQLSPDVGTAILERLPLEKDPAIRMGLILSLPFLSGEADPIEIPNTTQAWLFQHYEQDKDPGVHGAIDWILRVHLNKARELAELDNALRRDEAAPGLGWFIDRAGQTLSIIHPDNPVTLGSPDDEPGRGTSESLRKVQIPRVFAMATREVSLASYHRYVSASPETARPLPVIEVPSVLRNDQAPVVAVSWRDAAGYCNWLSKINNIDESQWCYANVGKDHCRLVPDVLEKTGYRLPTEAEWETACRAGTRSSRPFGDGWLRAHEFGWFPENADGRLRTCGQKRPNDFGLFDMLGNASEWTLSSYEAGNPVVTPPFPLDTVDVAPESLDQSRAIRGGSMLIPLRPRSATRDLSWPTNQLIDLGFRVCRTLH